VLNYFSRHRPFARTRRAGFFCAAVLLSVATGLQQQPSFARDAVTWIERYDEAIEEARKTGKPIFLEFRCAP